MFGCSVKVNSGRKVSLLFPLILTACASSLDLQEGPSQDYYGLKVGLERNYQARFQFCGQSCETLMKKKVVEEVPCHQGRAALVEIELPPVLAGDKMVPVRGREIIAETEAGFGFYEIKGRPPVEVDRQAIQIEIHKPFKVGN